MAEPERAYGNIVTILKNGQRTNIEEEDLARGDIVILQAGDIVPADLRLTASKGLEIDEFDITGEIMPVVKKDNTGDVPLYMGSKVLKGTGKGIVVTTGEQTEYGRIMKQSWEPEQAYAFTLIKRKYFIMVALLLPAFVLYIIRSGGSPIFIAAYLLLSAIFIILQNDDLLKDQIIQKELEKFRHQNLQIREPRSIERLKGVDTICFDKTGVLTTRNMSVRRIYFSDRIVAADDLTGENNTTRLVRLGSALCNDVQFYEKVMQANPVDQALIDFAQRQGINVKTLLSQVNRFYEQPFDSESRYMASGFEINHEEVYYFIKGDPGVILEMCQSFMPVTGEGKRLDFEFLKLMNSHVDAISHDGDSAIALAFASGTTDKVPEKYAFLCLFQPENSLQPAAQEVIRGVTRAGIRSLLLTGDRAETAVRIGKDSGIIDDSNAFLTGRDIDKMGWSEVIRQSSYCSIFARLIPSQKGVLIRLLQQKGHRIAMVGDGPNDGIALKVADVGISFVKNSSPIARRLSKVLINHLTDLLILLEGAQRIKRRTQQLKSLRILVLAASFVFFYLWAFGLFLR